MHASPGTANMRHHSLRAQCILQSERLGKEIAGAEAICFFLRTFTSAPLDSPSARSPLHPWIHHLHIHLCTLGFNMLVWHEGDL
eukprot:1150516-Pelagomonas_calceolata.AAC.2